MASTMISGFSRGKPTVFDVGISEGIWNHRVIRFWISTQEKRRKMSRELSCRARDLSSSGYQPFYLALALAPSLFVYFAAQPRGRWYGCRKNSHSLDSLIL